MSESARFNMVETQIRPADVTDQRVLAVLNAVPRER
ncbi:MAG: protein-L-isoaspartate O-methyltransferase, partial [Pseudolabrys sp.]|nr:protein-L-isoaspartate O-methyltransferase [Pseudolabrys sp.]